MKSIAAAAVLVLGFGGWWLAGMARAAKGKEAPGLSKEPWREDLRFLASELSKRHKNLFHHVSREQFERAVAELDAAIPSLADHQIAVRMLQLTAMVGDGHTRVRLPQTFKRYPLTFYWFGNDLRIVRAAKPYQQALGTRVLKIGDMPIRDVQKRLLSVISQDENEWFVLNSSPGYMAVPAVLHTLGVVPELDRASFTIADDQGRQRKLDVVPVTPDPGFRSFNGSMLSAAAAEPLYRQRPDEDLWWTYLPAARTVYVSFRAYDSLRDKVRPLFEFVDSHATDKLVIDMRQNGGGDFTKVRDTLIPALKQRPALNQKGRLFALIGRRTFSAAMTNAIDLRKETATILVGEPAGEKPNSYQENEQMTLPRSQLVVSYSTRYYKFLDQDAPAVEPDQRIDPTWDDYKAGRDPVLDWILARAVDPPTAPSPAVPHPL